MIHQNIYIKQLDNDLFIIKNLINNKYIKLGISELKYLVSILNIHDTTFNFNDVAELDFQSKKILKSKFEEWELIPSNKSFSNSRKKGIDLSKIKIFNFNPSKFLNKVPICIKKLFSKKGMFGVVLISLLPFLLMFFCGGQMLNDLQTFDYSLPKLLILVFLSLFDTIFHEMGHAISCAKFGGKVTSMGLLLFFLFPCFFVDVSDMYMLNNRKKSICVASAGVMVNLGLGSIIFFLYYILSLVGVCADVLLIFYFCNLGNVFYNLIPFVKLDGYWIFSSILKITNLAEKSTILFFAMIFKRKEYNEVCISKFKKVLLSSFGFISLFFRPIFWFASTSVFHDFAINISQINFIIVITIITIIASYNEFKLINHHIRKFKNERKTILNMI